MSIRVPVIPIESSTEGGRPSRLSRISMMRLSELGGWDVLRFVSFIDVASLHMSKKHVFGGIGLPVFLLISLALNARRRVPPDTKIFCKRKAQRLIYPWLFWSAVFFVLESLSQLRAGHAPFAWLEWSMLIAGTRPHLWFLPTLLAFSVLIHLLDRATETWPVKLLLSLCAVLGVGAFYLADQPHNALPVPFPQWIFAVPAVPLSLGIGRIISRSSTATEVRKNLGKYLGLVLALCALAYLLRPGEQHSVQVRYLAALLGLTLVLVVPLSAQAYTRKLREVLLGCYVLHTLVIGQINLRLARILGDEGAAVFVLQLVVMTLATVGLTLLLRRARFFRRVL